MNRILDEMGHHGTLWLVLTVLGTTSLGRLIRVEERRRLLLPIGFLVLHILLLPVHALLGAVPTVQVDVELLALLFEAMAFIGCAGVLLFGVALPAVGLRVPAIVRDVALAGATMLAGFAIAHRLDYSLHGLIATSAVVTGVIGISLQDTLGNLMAGLSLQADRGLAVGEWIKVGEASGTLREVGWRHSAIATRNGDLVLVPNTTMVRNQVVVVGRGNAHHLARRWVWFNVDFRTQPTDVMEAVEAALHRAPIPGVASEPRPTCILMDLGESSCRYAVRYWLADLERDDPTDSEVRTRVYFALSRASIPLALPAHVAFVTESDRRRERKGAEELERRRKVLATLDLFAHLSPEMQQELVERMRPASFARGEQIHHQGDEAHYLYVLWGGEVEERIGGAAGVDAVVVRIQAPGIFGELSLMTGTPRAASVVAITDAECYRLDKAAFTRMLQKPEVAEHMAQVIARRRVDLERAHEELAEDAKNARLQQTEHDVLARIRDFFGLDRPA